MLGTETKVTYFLLSLFVKNLYLQHHPLVMLSVPRPNGVFRRGCTCYCIWLGPILVNQALSQMRIRSPEASLVVAHL